MNYTFCAQTDPGRTRDNNEDSVAFDAATNLGVLADGMGGYNAGEIASGMATAYIKSELARWLSEANQQANAGEVRRAIEICVDNANRAIFGASCSNNQYAGMGTTLVVGVFQDKRLLLGHVGDSRCYRWRGTTLLQITKDHSLLQEQIDAGLLTPEQAATAPNKNLVTRALGVDDVVLLDLNEHQVEPGDIYLMCSDGLSDMMQDSAIAEVLQNGTSLALMAAELVTLANENGGRDNITVLLIEASTTPEKRGLMARLLGK
ncbi:MAG: Stp1/IreP family PP2C-type Ser/Thr phosphatase [Gammaproteobacteria bacterium]|uniref:Stp1/IreP family PP2C-type Ser/Thr phosphatase n=1 Tax=Rhodoferax sp. TaxID=50421 RepID=UPI001830FE92|nr:Stp1/IreP family PP2C-type Ser/Thr phosphatase [Rhodoferax sp.]MBU3898283.1 Stp1/IreP family PP2C-type Ser/Thr phosphatase [Gammaproteobacteria bacterium]MBA3059019.1 Stp1/IreP family PP2C-type Ser/Thr phosphatase [Rhodoferax sp.]MBU3998657.1 Stp1/IreP family PP2C-type Ser/Thr phosphatase [Gammaproteobacteria bacterium]MBU4081468.1 Stp1/IreP family PP2C-type Ser/Thr phosphatase [Gammaproteobacteria bacterium]MBU4114247.1 Stp1/IreP family PP2C-type Ser/Thr phosphatase [Gammaproteobacteria ba